MYYSEEFLLNTTVVDNRLTDGGAVSLTLRPPLCSSVLENLTATFKKFLDTYANRRVTEVHESSSVVLILCKMNPVHTL
jgi:hypothetical protein